MIGMDDVINGRGRRPAAGYADPYKGRRLTPEPAGLFEGLGDIWQWDGLATEIGQESRARVLLTGLPGAGKSLLFNRLRGWAVSPSLPHQAADRGRPQLEWYGAFVLADLPPHGDAYWLEEGELALILSEPALVVYLIDGVRGVSPADFRWVARLRAAGSPVVVALNKADELTTLTPALAEAEARLGVPVLPVSAMTGLNVEQGLLPAMLESAPHLAISLGREVQALRRTAARRVTRQAALLAAMMGAQPIPLLDLPFQASLQAGVVMRVGAAYGRTPSGGVNREVAGAVVSVLLLHYAAQTLSKFVPVLGWAVSGLLGAGGTMLIGELAIRYYEAGGAVPLPQWLRTYRSHSLSLPRLWQGRQRRGREEERPAGPWAKETSAPASPLAGHENGHRMNGG